MIDLIIDSGAFVAYYFDEGSSADKMQDFYNGIFTGDYRAIIPAINYGEILYVLGRNLDESELNQVKSEIRDILKTKIIQQSITDIEQAARIKSKGGLSYLDCFLLVEATKRPDCKIVTKDSEFKKFTAEYDFIFI